MFTTHYGKFEMVRHNRKYRTLSTEFYEVKVLKVNQSDRGSVTTEFWRVNGNLHREDGPAIIARHDATGIIIQEQWERNGRFHREDGPAFIKRSHVTGKIIHSTWHRNGEKVPAQKTPSISSNAAAISPDGL